MIGIDQAQIDPASARFFGDRFRLAGNAHGDRVEECGRGDLDPGAAQSRRQNLAEPMDPGRDPAKSLGPVPGGVSKARLNRSQAVTASAPCACSFAMASRWSRTAPLEPG